MKLKFNFGSMICGFMACTLFVLPTVAKPVVGANREWVRTAVQDQINQGKISAGIAILKKHLTEDDQDAESWARMALLQTRLLKCEEAQASLGRAASIAPTAMRDAYRSAADQLKSRGCQSQTADLAIPAQGNDGTAAAEWTASAKIRVGQDSNVMLLSDSVTNSDSPSSAFLNPVGQVDFRKVFERGVFEAHSLTSYTGYTSAVVEKYNSIYQSLSAEWEPAAADGKIWDKKFGNRFDVSFVNSDGMRFFSWVDTVYTQFSRSLGEASRVGFEIPLAYQKYAEEIATTSADKRDGFVVSPSVWIARRFDAFVWSTSLAYSQAMSSGENYRSRSPSVSMGISGNVTNEWRARANVAFTHSDYFESTLDRKDNRVDGGLGVGYNPTSRPNLNFGLDFYATENKSNLTGATYKRNTVMGQVDYAF